LTRGMFKGYTAEYVTREVLLGVTICFAQIPESVAFAFMAHVKPHIALHAAWMVGFICSAFGGRPGMVNGATGAFAAIIGTFVTQGGTGNNGDGVELLFPSVMFGGFLMLVVSFLGLSRFITLLPSPVMIGFCNGLAIVIGLAQLHPFTDQKTHEWKSGAELNWMLIICFSSMAVMEFLPKVPLKVFKVIPSSLLAIITAIVLEFAVARPIGHRTDVIGDVSEFTSDTSFPVPFFVKTNAADYDLGKIGTSEGIQKIIIQGILLCAVGCIESLMTAEVVESFCKTPGDGDRTVLAMGVGNMLSGLFGGMGGNAMIGLSTVNGLNGGRGRLGPIVTAFGIMACVMGAYPLLNFIPVAALAGVMLVVVMHTFKWFSLKMLVAALAPKSVRDRLGLHTKVPRVEVAVIVLVTLLSNWPKGTNIAYAVIAGIAICSIAHAWVAAMAFKVSASISEEGNIKYYDISGPMYFVTSNRLLKILTPDVDPPCVEVRFDDASSLLDYSAMETLHRIAASYELLEKKVVFKCLCSSTQKMIQKTGHLMKSISYKNEEQVMQPEPVFGVTPVVAELHQEGLLPV